MKYIATLHHYVSGSGYSHSEQYEIGTCEAAFDAETYAKEAGIETVSENGWTEVEIAFYADDADPAFDEPLARSVMNETVTGKF